MLTNILYPANRHLGGVSALPGTASCQPAMAGSLPLPTTLLRAQEEPLPVVTFSSIPNYRYCNT